MADVVFISILTPFLVPTQSDKAALWQIMKGGNHNPNETGKEVIYFNTCSAKRYV